MTLEEAEVALSGLDLESEARFSEHEKEAVCTLMASYMMGKIDRERAAKAMHCDVKELPTPWRGNA